MIFIHWRFSRTDILFFLKTEKNANNIIFVFSIDTRFGNDVFYKSGTFQKGPSRGVSSSSSAQSFPDGSGSFEVSASKIPA